MRSTSSMHLTEFSKQGLQGVVIRAPQHLWRVDSAGVSARSEGSNPYGVAKGVAGGYLQGCLS